MPGPLTADEKAQIKDHGKWGTGDVPAAYVQVYVDPTLDRLTDEAHLTIVRGHLAECNSLLEQMKTLSDDFDLDEAAGIKFAKDTENRVYGLYLFWRGKLYASLDLEINSSRKPRRRNRAIR